MWGKGLTFVTDNALFCVGGPLMTDEQKEQTTKQVHGILEGYLHGRGLRMTPERVAIVDAIYDMAGEHFTIEQLGARLDAVHFHVAQATLYNNMDMLLEAGLLWRHHFGASTLYEASVGTDPHYHCICRDCGMVTDLTNDRLTSRLAETRIRGFKVDYAYVYLYGLCTNCRRKATRRSRKYEKK